MYLLLIIYLLILHHASLVTKSLRVVLCVYNKVYELILRFIWYHIICAHINSWMKRKQEVKLYFLFEFNDG